MKVEYGYSKGGVLIMRDFSGRFVSIQSSTFRASIKDLGWAVDELSKIEDGKFQGQTSMGEEDIDETRFTRLYGLMQTIFRKHSRDQRLAAISPEDKKLIEEAEALQSYFVTYFRKMIVD